MGYQPGARGGMGGTAGTAQGWDTQANSEDGVVGGIHGGSVGVAVGQRWWVGGCARRRATRDTAAQVVVRPWRKGYVDMDMG